VHTLLLAPVCFHPRGWRSIGVYGGTGGSSTRDRWTGWTTEDWRQVMDIDWMTMTELRQAIPPAYTEFIGSHLRQVVAS